MCSIVKTLLIATAVGYSIRSRAQNNGQLYHFSIIVAELDRTILLYISKKMIILLLRTLNKQPTNFPALLSSTTIGILYNPNASPTSIIKHDSCCFLKQQLIGS